MRTYTVTEYDREDYEAIKENMTNEEAAHFLAIIDRGYVPDYQFNGSEDDYYNYCLHIAIRKAISLLESEV